MTITDQEKEKLKTVLNYAFENGYMQDFAQTVVRQSEDYEEGDWENSTFEITAIEVDDRKSDTPPQVKISYSISVEREDGQSVAAGTIHPQLFHVLFDPAFAMTVFGYEGDEQTELQKWEVEQIQILRMIQQGGSPIEAITMPKVEEDTDEQEDNGE